MRKLRILILIFFVVVTAIFAFSRVRDYLTSDSHAPVIQADSDSIQVYVGATDADLMAGMSAQDNLDGDVTDTLAVVSKSKFISKGTLRVNYAAFDRNNNVGTYSRNVTYVDYISPRFVVTSPLRFLSGNSDYDYLAGIGAEDCLDGNISGQIKMTLGDTTAVSDSVSRRMLNLQVTNSAGDTSVIELPLSFEDHKTYDEAAASKDVRKILPPGAMNITVVRKLYFQGHSVDFRCSLSEEGLRRFAEKRKYVFKQYDLVKDDHLEYYLYDKDHKIFFQFPHVNTGKLVGHHHADYLTCTAICGSEKKPPTMEDLLYVYDAKCSILWATYSK